MANILGFLMSHEVRHAILAEIDLGIHNYSIIPFVYALYTYDYCIQCFIFLFKFEITYNAYNKNNRHKNNVYNVNTFFQIYSSIKVKLYSSLIEYFFEYPHFLHRYNLTFLYGLEYLFSK